MAAGKMVLPGILFPEEEEAQAWCSPFYSEFCSNVGSLERPPLFMLIRKDILTLAISEDQIWLISTGNSKTAVELTH